MFLFFVVVTVLNLKNHKKILIDFNYLIFGSTYNQLKITHSANRNKDCQ